MLQTVRTVCQFLHSWTNEDKSSCSLELLYFILLIMAKQVRDGEETPARANVLTLKDN